MYTNFYNLTEKPFNLTPSPRYLYLGEVHKEALAFLTYGVVERKGFIVLTGEVGTGKTTMVQALLANLDENVETVYISNPMLSSRDFIDYLAFSAFKRKVRFKSKADFLVEFEEFLKECLRNQRTFLLIVDEAQRLSFSLLEEIRLLSNMETADEKLINIFLIGQPELNEKLSEPRCRALLQRISVRHHIKPLDEEETSEYVLTRLKIAGASNEERIFPKPTLKALYKYSEGYPRMINILADNALLLGYSRGKKKISPEMIQECYDDIRPKVDEKAAKPKESPIAKVMVNEKPRKSKRAWKLALLLMAFGALGIVGAVYRDDVSKRLDRIIGAHLWPTAAHITHKRAMPRQPKGYKMEPPPKDFEKHTREPDFVATEVETSGEAQTTGNLQPAVPHDAPEKKPVTEQTPSEIQPSREEITSWPVRVVRPGDTLAKLAVEVYGYADQKVLRLIQEHNPNIRNINLINVGQKIVFPPISDKETEPTYTVYIASYAPFSAARQEFQKLSAQGYEAYILPANDAEKGKIYRITLGNFDTLESAREYADMLVEKAITPYAQPMRLEVR